MQIVCVWSYEKPEHLQKDWLLAKKSSSDGLGKFTFHGDAIALTESE